jgi:hypothetical protein
MKKKLEQTDPADKLANEALEHIKTVQKTLPSLYNYVIKFWIKNAYNEGVIKTLEDLL